MTLPADVARCLGRVVKISPPLQHPDCWECERIKPSALMEAINDARIPVIEPPDLVDGKCPQRVEAR